jgi:hypothetical protein
MPLHGGTLFTLTWKQRATPVGHSISALRASARRTSGSGSTGWPTPTKDEAGGTPEQFLARKAKLGGSCGVSLTALNLVAQLAPWPSPQTRDHKGAMNPGNELTHNARPLNEVARLASWATPACTTGQGGQAKRMQTGRSNLIDQVMLVAPWATPNATDCESAGGPQQTSLTNQVTGRYATGSTAETASAGQLNPAHSRWLMGLPPEWDDCAPTATRSSRRSPRPSSKQPCEASA